MRMRSYIRAAVLAIFSLAALLADAQVASSCPPLTTEQVLQKLIKRNSERAQALPAYRSTRVYTVDYRGFPGSRRATMTVELQFTPPATKAFVVRSQTGSKLLVDRVVKKLLEEETLAFQPENQRRTALNDSNYLFSISGCDSSSHGPAFILSIAPRENSKYLYRGKIWVDAADFAVVRISGEPAKNPSFWIKQTQIEQLYQKVSEFWLPERNHSTSAVRLGGHAELTIEYGEYRFE